MKIPKNSTKRASYRRPYESSTALGDLEDNSKLTGVSDINKTHEVLPSEENHEAWRNIFSDQLNIIEEQKSNLERL